MQLLTVNTRPSPCRPAPLIHLRHMELYKCVLIEWLIDWWMDDGSIDRSIDQIDRSINRLIDGSIYWFDLLSWQAVDATGTPLCLHCQSPYQTSLVDKSTIEQNPWLTRLCSRQCMQQFWVRLLTCMTQVSNDDYTLCPNKKHVTTFSAITLRISARLQ